MEDTSRQIYNSIVEGDHASYNTTEIIKDLAIQLANYAYEHRVELTAGMVVGFYTAKRSGKSDAEALTQSGAGAAAAHALGGLYRWIKNNL